MKHAILATALAALSTLTADAALITWGTAQSITGDSNVSTAGSLVGALNIGSNTTTTVNGVTFAGALASGSTINSGIFSFAGSAVLSNFDDSTAGQPFGGLSLAYQQLIGPGIFTSGPVTLTISGLTAGAQYQFQFWTNISGPTVVNGAPLDAFPVTTATAGNAVTLFPIVTFGTGPDGAGGLGQFALGTFTANAPTQQITFSTNLVINAVQLRNLSPAVPEPGTALAGVMLAGLLGVRRRRAISAAH